MTRAARAACLLATVLVVGALIPSFAGAQSNVTGPTVMLDRYEAAPGEDLSLGISGFQARSVTISVCGNEGRRGSVDCDMPASLVRETPEGLRNTGFRLTAPPAPCPCIIRVSSSDQREVAVAPFVLVGHPVADVVGGNTTVQAIGVAITANPAEASFGQTLRTSLGGATTYDVAIRVTNRATFEVENIAVAATFTRGWSDDTRSIEVPDPGSLAPGQTWTETVQAEVPALTFGDVTWQATASGQGPSVTATETTSSQPILLYVLVAILAIDLLILAWRLIARVLRRERGNWEPEGNPFMDDPGPDDGPYEYVYIDAAADAGRPDGGRDRELVG